MPQNRMTPFVAALMLLGAASYGFAQEQTTETPAEEGTEAPAEGTATDVPVEVPAEEAAEEVVPDPLNDLSLGQPADGQQPADGPGSIYVKSNHESWELRCIRAEDGSDPCQLYQLLNSSENNPTAEISLFPLPEGQEAVVGATFVAPLGTLLTEQVRLQVDGATPKVYPFSWCDRIGCYSRIGLTTEEVNGFKRGNAATATIVPIGAPDEKVTLTISLKGFTAGFDAMLKETPPPAPAPDPAPQPAP